MRNVLEGWGEEVNGEVSRGKRGERKAGEDKGRRVLKVKKGISIKVGGLGSKQEGEFKKAGG